MGKKRRSRAFKENDRVIDFEEERRKRREKRQQISEKKKGRRESPPADSGRRTVKKIKRRFIYCCAGLIVLCVVGYSIYNVTALRREREQAEEAKLLLEKEKTRLERELSLADTDEYIEEKARDELHMIRDGERIYVLPTEETGASGISVSGQALSQQQSSDGALVVTKAALDAPEEESWFDIVLTGIRDTFDAVTGYLKKLVRK